MPDEPNPDEWVRVRQPETGHHVTVRRSSLEAHPGYVELKQEATRADGAPLPFKPHVEKGSARNEATATKKEN